MSKQSLLLVDGDTRSLRVLEVSLRKAGFTVTPAASVEEAKEALAQAQPDLIISETAFSSSVDGFAFRDQVRSNSQWAEIPFVFLTAETALENKIRGLELGVDDYLTKPIYIKEVIARINILLHKRQRAEFAKHSDGVQFSGRLADLPVVDVIQTIEVSRKSGVIQFVADRRRAAIYFRDGKVIDAEAGTLQGEDAVYRLLTWTDGEFEVVFRTVRRREVIAASSQALLMEGMRRLDEWSRLVEELPPLTRRFALDTVTLAERLGAIPDDNNPILRLIDGKRTLLEVIEAASLGDLECLQAISRLYFEGLLLEVEGASEASAPLGRQPESSGPVFANISAAFDAVDDFALSLGPPSSELSMEPEPAVGPNGGGGAMKLIEEAVSAVQADDIIPMEASLPVQPAARLARVRLATREADPRIANARAVVERLRDRKPTVRDSEESQRPELLERSQAPGSASSLAATDWPVAEPQTGDRSTAPETVAKSSEPVPELGPSNAVVVTNSGNDELRGAEESAGSDEPNVAAESSEAGALKMIGSHGKERAAAAGELNSAEPSAAAPPARELITIMPRRITRSPIPAQRVAVDPPSVRPPAAISPPARLPASTVAEGVRRPSSAQRSVAAVAALVASLVVVAVALQWSTRARDGGSHASPVTDNSSPAVVPPSDAATAAAVAAIPVDAVLTADAPVQATADGSAVRGDQRVESPTAVVEPVRAPLAPPPDAGTLPVANAARLDSIAEARRLYEKARAALEEGDARKALEYASASLKLRRTARTYLEYARALQRLGKTDAALEAVDAALQIVPTFAPSWAQRGMILWATRRREEARLAFQKYLALDPNGRDAVTVRQMLSQP